MATLPASLRQAIHGSMANFTAATELVSAMDKLYNVTNGTAAASGVLALDSDGKLSASFTAPTGSDDWGFWQATFTNPTGSKALRGLRINCNPAASATVGDTQAIHGRVTFPASITLAAGAAVQAGFDWLIFGNSLTTSTGNVLSAHRAIFNAGTNDLSGMSGGGESAIYYGQTWGTAGQIEHGLRIIAGSTSTIKNGLSVGGPGTFTNWIDMSDMADSFQTLFAFGLKDATVRNLGIYMGNAANNAAVFAEVPATAGLGSLYISSIGNLYIRKTGAGAESDWESVDSTDD